MISDLERIGDQASDIAGITGYIEDEQLKSGTHIYEMARAASRMVTDSVDSFVRKDLGKAVPSRRRTTSSTACSTP